MTSLTVVKYGIFIRNTYFRRSSLLNTLGNRTRAISFTHSALERSSSHKNLLCSSLRNSIGRTTFATPLLDNSRNYAKKRKKNANVEDETDDESEDDTDDDDEDDSEDMGDCIKSKSVTSLRIDAILKAGVGIKKKKLEKQFYASNIRVNEEKVLKKAVLINIGDEVDIVQGVSKDNEKCLEVDRVVLKSIGQLTGSGRLPVKLQVFKQLMIDNYADPWIPQDVV